MLILPSLNEGWEWTDSGFIFSWEKREADLQSETTDQSRTAKEITKMMCSVRSFLKFTCEESGMFASNTLPTLDTAIWQENQEIKFIFFEKETCGNRVLCKDTALPEQSLQSTMIQEVVRRLRNTSLSVSVSEKQQILSEFASKLYNSGYGVDEIKIILVQGVTKFYSLVSRNNLSVKSKRYKPLYLSKSYNEDERHVAKYLNKMCWFQGKNDRLDTEWRGELSGKWKGGKPVQKPVKGMQYSTILQVPNTKNGTLLKELARVEPRLAKITNWRR